MRAVGGADLAEHGAAAQHDVGDAELAADLDQLSPRDDDLSAVGERLERQQDGGRIVVDHQRVLGAGQPLQQRLHVAVPGAPFLPGQIELEIGVRRGDGLETLEGERAHQRPTQIGVQDDSLRIDDRT